jgi:hypothetical protein
MDQGLGSINLSAALWLEGVSYDCTRVSPQKGELIGDY